MQRLAAIDEPAMTKTGWWRVELETLIEPTREP